MEDLCVLEHMGSQERYEPVKKQLGGGDKGQNEC